MKQKAVKCPACGYYFGKDYIPGKEIRELLTERSPNTRKRLRMITNSIQTKVPSDNSQHRYFMFLQAISKIEDDIVLWVINRFILDGHLNKTRGFSYLKYIMLNEKTNRKQRLKNEYSSIGRPPSIRNRKETSQ